MVGFDFIYHKENDLLMRKQKLGQMFQFTG